MLTSALRRTRLAVIGVFLFSGIAVAMWVVNIPAVQAATGITHGTLGGLLLLLGLGSVIGMQASGFLIDKIGSRTVIGIGAVLLAVGVTLPGLLLTPTGIGVSLSVLGLGLGTTDVAMNDQAVLVERRYGKPIMSSFHAFFSVGGAIGAAVGAGMQALHLSMHWSLGFGAAVVIVLGVFTNPFLISASEPAASPAEAPSESARDGIAPRQVLGKILAMAALAFLLMLSEGSANDWSALQAVEHLAVPEAAASLMYGAFSVAMTVGRFATDPVVHRVGAAAVVRFGCALAAIGMIVVVLSSAYPMAFAGWVVFGLGLSGVVPQIFTAAGNLGTKRRGTVMGWIVGAGYVGLLAGPALIGWVSQATGLTHALLLPLVFCATGIFLARQVTVPRATTEPATTAQAAPKR